jgi:hypothetical protein
VVKIASFATKLSVIASKQRPRRLSLKGSDGQDYEYVLKGEYPTRCSEWGVDEDMQATRTSDRTSESCSCSAWSTTCS